MIRQHPDLAPATWWETAQELLPGGVNAAARMNRILGRPFLLSRGEGAILYDLEGRPFLDLNASFGAALLGYASPAITAAVTQATTEGLLCGHETLTPLEVARCLTTHIPSAEMVRFCGTGTETTWHAIRIARGYTSRSVVIKFEGHFHGYHDYLGYSAWPPLAQAGPEAQPTPVPESGGMPAELQKHILVLPFNNLPLLEATLQRYQGEVAAIIMEPVNYNSGTILPLPGYLEGVRELATRHEVVLIFDEILSGFRTGLSCIQGHCQVTPDLTTLGKAIGGGTPLSAIVGRREIMAQVAPLGAVKHSGTYIAPPIEMHAARAFLTEAEHPYFYPLLLERCEALYAGLRSTFAAAALPVKVQALGARFSLLFGIPETQPITTYREAAQANQALATEFYRQALDEGLYFYPGLHHGISAAHTEEQIEHVIQAVSRISRRLVA